MPLTHKLTRFLSSLRFTRPFLKIHPLPRPPSSTRKTMPKAGFYAVRVGREIGVYNSWGECRNQTEGYPNARYKRFNTQKAAEDFAHGAISSTSLPLKSDRSGAKGKKRAHAKIEDESCWDVVYSDGACKGNGKVGSVAGVGVWWGHNDPRNIAERCPGDQTNNRAELIAILRVLETTPLSKRPLLIKTDSEYSIKCFDQYIGKWMKKGWKTSAGKPVKNEGVIRCISSHLDIRSRSGQRVHLQHVKGHSGEVGNESADYLANEGTLKPSVEERDWKALEAQLVKVLDNIAPNTASVQGPVGTSITGTPDLESNSTVISLLGNEPSGTRIGVPEQDRLGWLDKLSSSPSESKSPGTPTKSRTTDETEFLVSSMLPSSLPLLVGNALLGPQNMEATGLAPSLDSNVSSQHPVFAKADPSSRAHNSTPQFLGGASRQFFCAESSSIESPVKVLYAAPPLVPVREEDVNFEDYADCFADNADLALELSD